MSELLGRVEVEVGAPDERERKDEAPALGPVASRLGGPPCAALEYGARLCVFEGLRGAEDGLGGTEPGIGDA